MHSLSKILSRQGRTITVRMASSDSVSLDAARTVSGDEYRELHGNNKYRLTVLKSTRRCRPKGLWSGGRGMESRGFNSIGVSMDLAVGSLMA